MSPHPSTNAVILLYLAIAAVAAGAVLHLGLAPPVWLMVVVLMGLFGWGITAVHVNRRSLLARFMILVYWLPFSATLGYLWDDNYVWCHTARAGPLCQDPLLISRLLLIGTIGLLGLFSGFAAAAMYWRPYQQPTVEAASRSRQTSLGPGLFTVLLLAGLGFSWLAAPQETMFEAMYAIGQTLALASSLNFNSAYMVSYLILILLYIDAERETAWPARRRTKLIAILAVSGFIIVYLQLLRGDRECTMLVVAFGSLYVTGPSAAARAESIKRLFRRRVGKLMAPAAAVVVVFLLVGSLRFSLSDVHSGHLDMLASLEDGFQQNTWTAVLLTNLGLAEEYTHGEIEYNYGQPYLDYLLSLPPGLISSAFGYVRPLEADRGPAWWYEGLSVGGIHAVCVPFKSFGAFGAFGILGLYGFLMARCEMLDRRSVMTRMLFVATISSGMLWFWYGDMLIIRALMIATMLAWTYGQICRQRTGCPARVVALSRMPCH